jgi:hypothetical protein
MVNPAMELPSNGRPSTKDFVFISADGMLS